MGAEDDKHLMLSGRDETEGHIATLGSRVRNRQRHLPGRPQRADVSSVRTTTAWRELAPVENARSKRVFIDPTWPYAENDPCSTCYSWIPRDSPCDHQKYECPTCGRRQCLLHWPYPMKTRREAVHFVKSAQVQTGKECLVRPVDKPRQDGSTKVWKIFTSEDVYASYSSTGKHRR